MMPGDMSINIGLGFRVATEDADRYVLLITHEDHNHLHIVINYHPEIGVKEYHSYLANMLRILALNTDVAAEPMTDEELDRFSVKAANHE